MSRTYRALAIVAVVATLLSAATQLLFIQGILDGWFSYRSLGILMAVWLTTSTLAGPVVGVLGIVTAAQARRWGWLVAFVLLGLPAAYAPPLDGYLGPYIDSALGDLALGFRTMTIIENGFVVLLPLVLLAIAALIFVASARSRQPHTDMALNSAPSLQ